MITPLDDHIADPGEPHAKADYAKRSEIPDVSGLAKKSEIPDVSKLVTQAQLTAALKDYALKSDLPDLSGYVKTADLTVYAKKTDLPDVSGLAKRTELADYAKKSDIPDVSLLAKKTDLAPYAKSADVTVQFAKAAANPVSYIAVSAPRTPLTDANVWTTLALTQIAVTAGFSLTGGNGIKVEQAGVYLLVGTLHVNNMDVQCKYYGLWSLGSDQPLDGLYGGQAAAKSEGFSGLVAPCYPVKLAAGDVLHLQAQSQKNPDSGPAPKAVLYQAQASVIRLGDPPAA